MCEMCNGKTLEEVIFTTSMMIDLNGYTLIGVEGPAMWFYTIGLLHKRGHPELVVVNCAPAYATGLLGRLAGRVLDGERLEPGQLVMEAGGPYDLAEVHPTRLRAGLCNWWENYDTLFGGNRGGLRVLQVQMPSWRYGDQHAAHPLRLDTPGGLPRPIAVPGPGPGPAPGPGSSPRHRQRPSRNRPRGRRRGR